MGMESPQEQGLAACWRSAEMVRAPQFGCGESGEQVHQAELLGSTFASTPQMDHHSVGLPRELGCEEGVVLVFE